MFIPDPDFLPKQDPGSRGQKDTGSGIRIRNTGLLSNSDGERLAVQRAGGGDGAARG
jgi:hypothetical protein